MMPLGARIVRHCPAGHEAAGDAMSVMNRAFDPFFREAWTEQQLSGMTMLSGVSLFIASLGIVPMAFALTRSIFDEAELLLLAVEPKWQKRHIGVELLRAVESALRTDGVASLHLEVRENNSARSFYENCGFEQVFRRPDYYTGADGSKYDALTYKKSL